MNIYVCITLKNARVVNRHDVARRNVPAPERLRKAGGASGGRQDIATRRLIMRANFPVSGHGAGRFDVPRTAG